MTPPTTLAEVNAWADAVTPQIFEKAITEARAGNIRLRHHLDTVGIRWRDDG
ncbi:hypothetical protein [Acidiphilium sp.]|uniref:hypothetical protein n=1 Tax=Acidiphilium sp. TaxID=527 RepID=UPI003CFC5273